MILSQLISFPCAETFQCYMELYNLKKNRFYFKQMAFFHSNENVFVVKPVYFDTAATYIYIRATFYKQKQNLLQISVENSFAEVCPPRRRTATSRFENLAVKNSFLNAVGICLCTSHSSSSSLDTHIYRKQTGLRGHLLKI